MEPSGSRQKRLVLCFDGTGNKYNGNDSDTNIVKLYKLLNRDTDDQFHYYQPGIGTYVENQKSSTSTGGLFTKIKSKIQTTVDQAIGTTFVSHVLAGYSFIMRYYNPGDHIYIFGFSRGAYTARFLAEMVHSIGLLSRGNEEMVRFAEATFSDYMRARGNDPMKQVDRDRIAFMNNFKETFCRPAVTVHFLGLFDCVNSVGQFEIPLFRTSYQAIATPPATHIRHAISIHERRLKFKPALFLIDDNTHSSTILKEVWFAGNHGDVGGGWGPENGQKCLLSDTPLAWMLQEVQNLPDTEKGLDLHQDAVDKWLNQEVEFEKQLLGYASEKPPNLQPHDMLSFKHNVSWYKTLGWWVLEILPFFTRLELEKGKWVPRYWPPNMGSLRDIPSDAHIHATVDGMLKAGLLKPEQMPKLGGDSPVTILPSNAVKNMRAGRMSEDGANSDEGEDGGRKIFSWK